MNKWLSKRSLVIAFLVCCLLSSSLLATWQLAQAEADGTYAANGEVTYKEYWISHTEYTAGCSSPTPNSWYLEPWPGCHKFLHFNIPDNFAQAGKVEIYLNLWRNRKKPSARYKLNGGAVEHAPTVGNEWGRTPWIEEIAKSELRQGDNVIEFWDAHGGYHVHDIGFRIYYDAAHPLIAGAGSDVTPPTGRLTSVVAANGSFDPAVGGTLNVDNNAITLNAAADGAAWVEFHGYYAGYDEDNNGLFTDWHSVNRNNYNPGGTKVRAIGGAVDNLGTDATAPYSVIWSLPTIANQSGVKFKVRVADGSGNFREAAGGVSAAFSLARAYQVESYTIPNFADDILWGNGGYAGKVQRSMDLPNLNGVTAAYILGHYWQNPLIALNGNPSFAAFVPKSDFWVLSTQSVPVNQLRAGANVIEYSHNSGWGEFIEKPGPMIVLVRGGGGGPTPTFTPTPTRTPVVPPTATTTPVAPPTATPAPTATPVNSTCADTGLVALYTFLEGSGATVLDKSNVGTPLNLTIAAPSAVSWVAGGGLQVNGTTIIASAGPATKINAASLASNQLSIEAWIKPANLTQNGPARIVSLSQDPYLRNVTLGQGNNAGLPFYSYRLRTSTTSTNGIPALVSADGSVTTAFQHVTLTFDAAGTRKLYLNGLLVVSDTPAGNLAGWSSSFRLALANELTNDRPWLGTYQKVAIYCKALNAAQIQAHVAQGMAASPEAIHATDVALANATVSSQATDQAANLGDGSEPVESPITVDNGLVPLVASGVIWMDSNGNGAVDAGEAALAGTQVEAHGVDVNGNSHQVTVQSDSDGNYALTWLPPGEYTVKVTLPAGYTTLMPTETQITVESNSPAVNLNIPAQQTASEASMKIFMPLVAR